MTQQGHHRSRKNMILGKQTTAGLTVAVLATTLSAQAAFAFPLGGKKKEQVLPPKLTPAQNQLIDKSIAREKEVIKAIKERAPLVETYIQNMRPDNQLVQVPESDQHFLGRVEFDRI